MRPTDGLEQSMRSSKIDSQQNLSDGRISSENILVYPPFIPCGKRASHLCCTVCFHIFHFLYRFSPLSYPLPLLKPKSIIGRLVGSILLLKRDKRRGIYHPEFFCNLFLGPLVIWIDSSRRLTSRSPEMQQPATDTRIMEESHVTSKFTHISTYLDPEPIRIK